MTLITIIGLLPLSIFEEDPAFSLCHFFFVILALMHIPKVLKFANKGFGFRGWKGLLLILVMNIPPQLFMREYRISMAISFIVVAASFLLLDKWNSQSSNELLPQPSRALKEKVALQ
jgi:hypothetical protein